MSTPLSGYDQHNLCICGLHRIPPGNATDAGAGLCSHVIATAERIRDAAVAAERVRLLGKLETLHAPFKIYDECDHEHTDEDVAAGRAFAVPKVGYTCKLIYVCCRSCCCTNDGVQDWPIEDCAIYHKHTRNPDYRCPTAALVADERGGTP